MRQRKTTDRTQSRAASRFRIHEGRSAPLRHNGHVFGRRQFLQAGAAGAVALRATTADEGEPPGLALEYGLSSPPPIPPGIELDPAARAVVEISGSQTTAHCALGVRVRLNDEACLLPLAIWTGNRHTYWRFREGLRLPAFRGHVRFADGVWSLEVDGRRTFEARAGAPADASSDSVLPWLTYKFALAADWTRGPLGEGPTQLWSVRPRDSADAPTRSVKTVEASGDLDGWLTRLGAVGPVGATTGGTRASFREQFERDVDPEALKPFAFRNLPGGRHGVPNDTTFANAEALEAYRGRREVRLAGLVIVAIDCFASHSRVESLLPPPCIALANPTVRVLAARGLEDPGLDEAWLFADCSLDGQRAWYAVSHIRPSLAGTEFGRDVLGHPTKDGAVQAMAGGNRFSASVSRDGRSLYQCHGNFGGFSTGTTMANMTVAGMRLRHGPAGGAPHGEIVTQRWHYQGLRLPVQRANLDAWFPAEGRGEVWGAIGPVQAYGAMVMDSAGMQRRPAAPVARFGEPGPYYRARCDWRLPWNPVDAGREERTEGT